ncbi:MAG: DUF934 domain-containing protein [Granulosicoccus sp.]
MPLLRNGHWVNENAWVRLADEDALPASDSSEHPLLCSLARFLDIESKQHRIISGVWLNSDDDVTPLAPYLDQLQLISIDFPVYTDGRGYSQARVLRKQLSFAGELRATGDVRVDQILFMARAGIDAFEFPVEPDHTLVEQILSRFQLNYQPSYALPLAG